MSPGDGDGSGGGFASSGILSVCWVVRDLCGSVVDFRGLRLLGSLGVEVDPERRFQVHDWVESEG